MASLNTAILFNDGTGADGDGSTDAGASGVGPATAVKGTCDLNSSTSITNVTDTTGVSAGDLICVLSSSGRKFARIASIAGTDPTSTITTDETWGVTETGRNYAIGGKRATWDNATSRQLFSDYTASWIIETETSQTLSNGSLPMAGTTGSLRSTPVIIRGSSGSRKTFTQATTNSPHFNCATAGGSDVLRWQRLAFVNTGAGKTDAVGMYCDHGNRLGTAVWTVVDCEFGDASSTMESALKCQATNDRIGLLVMIDSHIHDCTGHGVNYSATLMTTLQIYGCMFVDNALDGYFSNTSNFGIEFLVFNSVFANNGSDGLSVGGYNADTPGVLINNVFSDNSANGFNIDSAADGARFVLANNIFAFNGSYGIGGTDASFVQGSGMLHRNNNFYQNTVGHVEEADIGTGNDPQINVDPQFTNRANNDFSIGSNLAGLGYPSNLGEAGLTTSSIDIGASQRVEAGGGGGGLLRHPGMTGGING